MDEKSRAAVKMVQEASLRRLENHSLSSSLSPAYVPGSISENSQQCLDFRHIFPVHQERDTIVWGFELAENVSKAC